MQHPCRCIVTYIAILGLLGLKGQELKCMTNSLLVAGAGAVTEHLEISVGKLSSAQGSGLGFECTVVDGCKQSVLI